MRSGRCVLFLFAVAAGCGGSARLATRDGAPATTDGSRRGDVAVTWPVAAADAAAPSSRDTAVDPADAIVPDDADGVPAVRDPYLWPFASTSIWNMPIGDGAIFKPANLGAASHVGVDIQHILKLRATDPERGVLGSPTFGPGRCGGTEALGFSIRVPDTWIVPDAGNSPYGGTPNSNFAFLLPDGDTVFEGSLVSRCVAGGPVFLPTWMKFENNRKHQSLRGSGLDGGGQGASGMSALGGTIRKGELVGAGPIRHVIKVNPWAEKYVAYGPARGFRWPARAADSYAPTGYKGTNPGVLMGSLLAIPPTVSASSIGITTEPGRKLFRVMQDYGAYFTEDAAWDTWDLIVERDAELEFKATYGFAMTDARWRDEVNRVMQAAHVVDNNGPDSIGGGGKPRRPLAPELAR